MYAHTAHTHEHIQTHSGPFTHVTGHIDTPRGIYTHMRARTYTVGGTESDSNSYWSQRIQTIENPSSGAWWLETVGT